MKSKSKLTIIAIIVGMLLLSTACDPGGGDGVDPCLDGHDFSANVTTTATCTEAGQDAHKCTRCPYTVYTDAPALGHIAPGAVPATCTTAGNSGTGTCTRCGVSITGNVIPALGHDHFESLVCNRTGCDHQYVLGNPGPGGGFIFYVADSISGRTPFKLYLNATDNTGITAHYLEAAPRGWNGTNDPGLAWATTGSGAYSTVSGTSFEIGTGRKNTALILARAGNTPSSVPAANTCRQYSTPTTTAGEWFFPSIEELAQLRTFHISASAGRYPGLTTGLTDSSYWSSSQNATYSGTAWYQSFALLMRSTTVKDNARSVRAIRAF